MCHTFNGKMLLRFVWIFTLKVGTMVEIYNTIAYIPLLNKIFGYKNKNDSLKESSYFSW